jgi:DNA-binding response OmpR family regulator
MRILVAEDDAPLAEFLHQWLLQEKFAVQMMASGPEAQRFASDQSYDLVVLDLNRNGSVGLDALRSIRLQKPDQPVLMVARANVVEDRVRGLNAGADDFVAKPFEVAELAARIRAVVRRGNRTGRSFAGERSEVGSHHPRRASAGPPNRSEPKGIFFAGTFDAPRRAAGVASGHCGASVEAELRHHD